MTTNAARVLSVNVGTVREFEYGGRPARSAIWKSPAVGRIAVRGVNLAGDDQADAGAKTFQREYDLSLTQNARELLDLSQNALARIDDGSYGVCVSCGQPIGKARLQAFPRATLCVACKQREERR